MVRAARIDSRLEVGALRNEFFERHFIPEQHSAADHVEKRWVAWYAS